jgi:hypothetical protein
MSNKTTIALAAAVMLASASMVMAGDSGENDKGGSVMPGSSVGVNPADHPNNPAVQSMKPRAAEPGIRTEGRGQPEVPPSKDPENPGAPDTRK